MQFQRTAIQPPTNVAPVAIKRNSEATRRYSIEKASAEIFRALAGKNFSSLEEANAFARRVIAQHNADITWKTKPEDKKTRLGLPVTEAEPPSSERAQDLMYEAWGEKGSKRIELANEALSINPGCADAYVLLGQEVATTLEEAKALFEKAMEAGEKSIGKQGVEYKEGELEFWTRIETRPYLRAKSALAATLWLLGEHDAAIAHMQEVIRLNPSDNQGIRYQLFNWFVVEDRDDDANKLMERFDGDRWAFGQALLAFKSQGDTRQARYKLRIAIQENDHVVPLLIGREKLPELMPAFVGVGDQDEAIEYVSLAKDAWSQVPGAIEWLQQVSDQITSQRKSQAYKLWEIRMQSAYRAMSEERYNKAKGDLVYARKQAEKFGEDHFALCQTMSKLAYVYAGIGPLPEDESIFRQAVELTEEVYGSEHEYLGPDLYHLGTFLLAHNKIDEAESVLVRARTLAEKMEEPHFISSVLMDLSNVYQAQGKELLAKQVRAESERIHKELQEEGHHCDH